MGIFWPGNHKNLFTTAHTNSGRIRIFDAATPASSKF